MNCRRELSIREVSDSIWNEYSFRCFERAYLKKYQTKQLVFKKRIRFSCLILSVLILILTFITRSDSLSIGIVLISLAGIGVFSNLLFLVADKPKSDDQMNLLYLLIHKQDKYYLKVENIWKSIDENNHNTMKKLYNKINNSCYSFEKDTSDIKNALRINKNIKSIKRFAGREVLELKKRYKNKS